MSPLRKGHLDIITFATFTKAQFKVELAQFASNKKDLGGTGKEMERGGRVEGSGEPYHGKFLGTRGFVLFFFINR